MGQVSFIVRIFYNFQEEARLSFSIAPAREAIEYQTKVFEVGLAGTEELFGHPDPQKDMAWEKLLERKPIP